jgi:hypothetical protein
MLARYRSTGACFRTGLGQAHGRLLCGIVRLSAFCSCWRGWMVLRVLLCAELMFWLCCLVGFVRCNKQADATPCSSCARCRTAIVALPTLNRLGQPFIWVTFESLLENDEFTLQYKLSEAAVPSFQGMFEASRGNMMGLVAGKGLFLSLTSALVALSSNNSAEPLHVVSQDDACEATCAVFPVVKLHCLTQNHQARHDKQKACLVLSPVTNTIILNHHMYTRTHTILTSYRYHAVQYKLITSR